jgi:hypothetical protein
MVSMPCLIVVQGNTLHCPVAIEVSGIDAKTLLLVVRCYETNCFSIPYCTPTQDD